jgi:hypothetical protein
MEYGLQEDGFDGLLMPCDGMTRRSAAVVVVRDVQMGFEPLEEAFV